MANVEINDLAAKATPVSTDEIEVQATAGGTSNKATLLNAEKGMILSGSGAPATTPNHVGQRYVDLTNDNVYIATDTVSSADWEQVTLGGTTIAGLTEETDPTLSQFLILSNDKKYALNKLTTGTMGFIIDGGGSAITTGIKGDLSIDYAATINAVTLLADQSGSIVVDIWKDTYANFPPTDADSITASAVPTITTATKAQDTTLTGWTTSLAAGDILRFNVDSVTSITRLTIILDLIKTGA